MNINETYIRVTMPDGTIWDVPVAIIAKNRAEVYKDEFHNDLEQSLKEDTIPLFEDSTDEILDWAVNNMDWSDVSDSAIFSGYIKIPNAFQEGWMNGKKELITKNDEVLPRHRHVYIDGSCSCGYRDAL